MYPYCYEQKNVKVQGGSNKSRGGGTMGGQNLDKRNTLTEMDTQESEIHM